MVTVKEKDFIEVDYVGRVKDTGMIFDLTDKELAKKSGYYNEQAKYGSRIICLGESQILKSLDKELIGKEVGKVYNIDLNPENAFGKKDPGMVKVVQTSVLLQQKINPFPGLQINASGVMGKILTVNGSRTVIDFNHPLAGKAISYEIKILKLVKDNREKISGLLESLLNINSRDYELIVDDNKFVAKMKVDVPSEIKSEVIKRAKVLIPVAGLSFS